MSELLITRRPGVVEVTFNRPERRNAFTAAMYADLHALWGELAEDRETRVVVLRGAGGKAFAAGNEISDFLAQDAVSYEASIRAMFDRLFALPQVTLAVIDGVAVGGGLAVATYCDLRVATPHSRFGYPIARTLGNALSTPVLFRCAEVFGEALTREMLLASRLVTAERAYAAGAIMAVAEDLETEVDAIVEGLLQASPVTLRVTKDQLRRRARAVEAEPADEAAMLREVYAGPDFAEGVTAFLEKRTPAFGG